MAFSETISGAAGAPFWLGGVNCASGPSIAEGHWDTLLHGCFLSVCILIPSEPNTKAIATQNHVFSL